MVVTPSAASAASTSAMPARMSGLVTCWPTSRLRPDDDGAMRVAEDDLRAHGDQLVDKEEPALVHLLVDDDRALRLGGRHQGDAHEVGREGGPGRVVDLGHGAAKVRPHAQILRLASMTRV